MRERILKGGFDSLFPHELLEYILFGAFPQGDTNELAHKILAAFGTLEKVFSASIQELMAVDGVGEAAAVHLSSYSFVAKSLNKDKIKEMTSLRSLGEIKDYLSPFFLDKSREEFHVLLIDESFKLIRHMIMSSPITSKVYVDMDEVMKAVALAKPRAVVFSHNHPSGSATPSTSDLDFTKKYFMALSLAFNITLSEHMIFAKGGSVYSFRNGGEIKKIIDEYSRIQGQNLSDNFNLGGFYE